MGDVPEAPAGAPDARDLTGEARKEWDRMVARLSAVGTLSTIDDAALRRYAKLHAETESLEAEHTRLARLSSRLTKEARRLEGADLVAAIGEIVALQKLGGRLLPQLRQGAMALRQWLVELGMTPAARGRVKASAPAAAADDPKKRRYLRALATK
jgi:phage terminase small subunit